MEKIQKREKQQRIRKYVGNLSTLSRKKRRDRSGEGEAKNGEES